MTTFKQQKRSVADFWGGVTVQLFELKTANKLSVEGRRSLLLQVCPSKQLQQFGAKQTPLIFSLKPLSFGLCQR